MDKDLASKLSPLSKLRIYRELRKVIFVFMESGKMMPEKSNEILAYLKVNLVPVGTVLEAGQFLDDLVTKYPELSCVSCKFEVMTDERIHEVFVILLDSIMSKGNFDLAEELMNEISVLEDGWDKDLFQKIQDDFPEEFDSAVKKVSDDLESP